MGQVTPAHRTAWNKRSRLNVESDMSFDAANTNAHLSLGTLGVQWNLGTEFSFSVFLERTSVGGGYIFQAIKGGQQLLITRSGTQYVIKVIGSLGLVDATITIGSTLDKIHLAVVYNGVNLNVYINSVLDLSVVDANSGQNFDFNGGTPAVIGNRSNLTIPFLGTLSHVIWFAKALTQQEISFIHINGGLAPESAHKNCIAHYPMTERYAFKADAAFIVNHPQFIVGDNVFFDTVEQYSYAVPINAVSKSLQFTGSNSEVVNIPDNANLKFGTGDFTVSVWVKIDTIGAGQEILSKHYSNYELLINGSGNFVGYVGGLTNSVGSIVATAGEWYNVLITRNGGGANNLKMYLNGVFASQATNTATTSTTADIIEIGSRPGEGIFLTGNVCQASIWNQGFSSDEAKEIYNFGNPIDELTHSAVANLVSLWEMGGGVGDSIATIVDQQGSNDGTPVNMIAGDIVDDIPVFLPQANHANAKNFTDAEVGSVNPSTQTVKSDFYSKLIPDLMYLNIDGGGVIKKTIAYSFTDKLTFAVTINIEKGALATNSFLISLTQTTTLRVSIFKTVLGYRFIVDGVFVDTGILATDIKVIRLIGVYDGVNISIYANGVFKSSTAKVGNIATHNTIKIGANSFDGVSNNLFLKDVQIWDAPFDAADVLYDYDNNDLASNRVGTSLVIGDLLSHYPVRQNDTILYDEDDQTNNISLIGTGEIMVEKDSLLPEIKQAWINPATGGFTIPIAFNPSSDNGLTFIWSGVVDLAKTTIMFSKREDGSNYSQFYITTGGFLGSAISGNAPTAAVNQIDINKVSFDKINTYHLIYEPEGAGARIRMGVNGVELFNSTTVGYEDYDELVAETTIAKTSIGQQDDSTVLRAEIHQGVLSQKQLLNIHNNMLLSNNEKDSALWKMLCNLGGFSEDGADVFNADLIAGNDPVVDGLTGGSSALRLADVPNHLIDIEQLR